MTKKYLEQHGQLVDECDAYDGGIYLYTNYYYFIDNELYCSVEHSNQMRYTGKNTTYIIIDDVNKSIKNDDESYFTGYPLFMNDSGYEKLKSLVNDIPRGSSNE